METGGLNRNDHKSNYGCYPGIISQKEVMWRHGSVTVKAIKESDQKRETNMIVEAIDIGGDVAGYMVKDLGDSWLLFIA